MNRRIEYLDIAKAIGIILVMISHSCGMPFNTTMYFANFYIQLFWIISGITYADGRKITDNIEKKFATLIKPYFIYSCMIVLLNILLQNFESLEELFLSIGGIIYSRYALYPLCVPDNVLFLQIGNSPLWFLTSMFVGCCIFYVVIKISCKQKWKKIFVGIGLLLITILLSKVPVLLPWSLDTAFLTAWFMLVGYCMRDAFMKKYSIFAIAVCSMLYIVICYWNGAVNLSIRIYGNHEIWSIFMTCVLGILGSLVCISIARVINKIAIVRNIFMVIGRNTLILLALHMSVFSIFDMVLRYFGILYNDNAILYYGVGSIRLVVAIGVCIGIIWIKEKWIDKR